jgi:hypothetical protein
VSIAKLVLVRSLVKYAFANAKANGMKSFELSAFQESGILTGAQLASLNVRCSAVFKRKRNEIQAHEAVKYSKTEEFARGRTK